MDITIVVNIIKIIFYPFKAVYNFILFLDRCYIEKEGNRYYWRMMSARDYRKIGIQRSKFRY